MQLDLKKYQVLVCTFCIGIGTNKKNYIITYYMGAIPLIQITLKL